MIERYSRPELVAHWANGRRYETWLEVELCACEAMEQEGYVPAGTAAKVREKASGKLSAESIDEIELKTRHDVIAFLSHVENIAGEPARWLHLGLTSSDVLDTSLAILTRDALVPILAGIDQLRAACKTRAEEHRKTPMIGRSHGIHAEPTSAGLTFARFYAELGRAKARVQRAKETISVGKLAGAVGTYGNVSPVVEAVAFKKLGLVPETVATQVVARDRHAEVLMSLALLATAVEQIALCVRHWQRTEVGEAEEAFGKGQKGSSAMPHKKNPILSENLCGLSRLVRSHVDGALQNVVLWHERDISHSSVERVSLPDATTLVHFMLYRATQLVSGLVIHKDRMLENLNRTRGLVFSEAILLSLIKSGLPRQRAYEIVQAQAMAAHEGKGEFRELLGAEPDIKERMTVEQLDDAFDLEHHLCHVDTIFERAFAS